MTAALHRVVEWPQTRDEAWNEADAVLLTARNLTEDVGAKQVDGKGSRGPRELPYRRRNVATWCASDYHFRRVELKFRPFTLRFLSTNEANTFASICL